MHTKHTHIENKSEEGIEEKLERQTGSETADINQAKWMARCALWWK